MKTDYVFLRHWVLMEIEMFLNNMKVEWEREIYMTRIKEGPYKTYLFLIYFFLLTIMNILTLCFFYSLEYSITFRKLNLILWYFYLYQLADTIANEDDIGAAELLAGSLWDEVAQDGSTVDSGECGGTSFMTVGHCLVVSIVRFCQEHFLWVIWHCNSL